MDKVGVLLVNLGTPDSQDPSDVKKYLIEFLTDGRVIDQPWLQRQLLVRGAIVPKRYRESAKAYARIWNSDGSPLKTHGEKVKGMLQCALGSGFQVELAMRYQNPTIKSALERLKFLKELIVIPLFPQYASATTGSIHQKVMEIVSSWELIPKFRLVNSFPFQREMIAAFCDRAYAFDISSYDHFLFSFHGLPERQIKKADPHSCCLADSECCKKLTNKNQFCYSAQCHQTAQAITQSLSLPENLVSLTFQSRLGKDPWLKPYTADTVDLLAKKGFKRLLVFCPAFVCDCLETLDEIGHELKKAFIAQGGEALDLVPGLNDHPIWIKALESLVLESAPLQAQVLNGRV